MGEIMDKSDKIKVFNSPLEIALRVLLILHLSGKKSLSLERLIIYDYLIIHSGDKNTLINTVEKTVRKAN